MRSFSSPVLDYLNELHAEYKGLNDGNVATYIPELAKANPDWFGICLATASGAVYEAGDFLQPFTIQSISKPFVYGLALEDNGRAEVLKKVGVEPTGDAFNSISLDSGTGRPRNPMINAGAIASAGLIAGKADETKLRRLLETFAHYAGREVGLDQTVYNSESQTGHRNRAIGYMLRNFNILDGDPTPIVELYFKQCSVSVTCRDLGVMAATLANRGVNPLTGKQAIRGEYVENVLSVMGSCGMYDYAGEWIYNIGMPAKSGVSGGVIAVLPGQLGIGVFSPRLDARGNSVRGIAACTDLSRDLHLHCLRVPRSARAAIRTEYTLERVGSTRRRTAADRETLDAVGARARVFHLQGDLAFSVLETVVRRLVEQSPQLTFAIMDLSRVTLVDPAAVTVLAELIAGFAETGKRILFVGGKPHARALRQLEERVSALEPNARLAVFDDLDTALEWCENRLLAEAARPRRSDAAVQLAEHDLCRGMDADMVHRLEGLLTRERFGTGDLIVRQGDRADKLYMLLRGEVSVTLPLPNQRVARLSTLSAGMSFGEFGLLDGGVRSADVHADGDVECFSLSRDVFDRLGVAHPAIKLRLLENLLRGVSHMLARADEEIATLRE